MLASAGTWAGSSTNCVGSTDFALALVAIGGGMVAAISGGEERGGGTEDMEMVKEQKTEGNLARSRVLCNENSLGLP